MKKLEFTTSKGEFILQDCPKELLEFTFSESTRLVINGIKYKPFGVVKHMTEEQFAEVVDSFELYGNINVGYKNYTEEEPVLDTAKESFESLIKSLRWYLFENPIENWKDEMYYETTIEEAESKTLYNPIILKKV